MKHHDWVGWFFLALTLLALGLFLEKLKGESVKEMQSINFVKPDTWVGAYRCECRPFKWLDEKEVFWTVEGRVLYLGQKSWQVVVKEWRKADAPEEVYLYMARLICSNWIHFIVSEYNEDVNTVDIADLRGY